MSTIIRVSKATRTRKDLTFSAEGRARLRDGLDRRAFTCAELLMLERQGCCWAAPNGLRLSAAATFFGSCEPVHRDDRRDIARLSGGCAEVP